MTNEGIWSFTLNPNPVMIITIYIDLEKHHVYAKSQISLQ